MPEAVVRLARRYLAQMPCGWLAMEVHSTRWGTAMDVFAGLFLFFALVLGYVARFICRLGDVELVIDHKLALINNAGALLTVARISSGRPISS